MIEMGDERQDPERGVVETVELRWDDAADRVQAVVLDTRPMTGRELAIADLARHGEERARLEGLAEGRRREALDALEALERTAQAGQTLILAARDGGLQPETYTALAREIDRWHRDARAALAGAGQARGELLWTQHRLDRAQDAYDAVAAEAEAVP